MNLGHLKLESCAFHPPWLGMGVLLVLSDVHRAGAMEQGRRGFDSRAVANPFLRTFQRGYRRYVWMDDPMAHNHLLEAIVRRVPKVSWAGHSIRRYTAALNEARCWREFRVTLCPSPTGIQLLKDGGYLTSEWSASGPQVSWKAHGLPWSG